MKWLFCLIASFALTTWLSAMNPSPLPNAHQMGSPDCFATFGPLGWQEWKKTENESMNTKCLDHKWEYLSVECTQIEGRPAYCFKLIVYKARECDKFAYSINQNLLLNSVDWAYDNVGNLIIKGCFQGQGAEHLLCIKIDFLNPECCDLEACVRLPCCQDTKWEGKVYCKKIDGQWSYYYKVVLYDVKTCGKFTFSTSFPSVPGSQQIVYDASSNAIVTGWILASSVPLNIAKLCFKVDFKEPLCCDFKGCMELPSCCGDPKWKGKVTCAYVNGQKAYCYLIKIADAKECDGVKVNVEGTPLGTQTTTYDANGNAIVQGCVLASSLAGPELCFKVDFKSSTCCDFKGCMKLPECDCIEKSYGFEELSCTIIDGKKVYCFVFLVKEAKECLDFDYSANGTTVDGPVMSYGPNGELYIKHCITQVHGDELCLKIDWKSDLCCDISACAPLPECSEGPGRMPTIDERRQTDDVVKSKGLDVYPLPADTYIHVKLPAVYTPSIIMVSDMNHKALVRMTPITQETSIYTGAMPNGLYFLQLYDLNGKLLASRKIPVFHR